MRLTGKETRGSVVHRHCWAMCLTLYLFVGLCMPALAEEKAQKSNAACATNVQLNQILRDFEALEVDRQDPVALRRVFSPHITNWITLENIPERLVNAFKATEYFSISGSIFDKAKFDERCARSRFQIKDILSLDENEMWRCIRCVSPIIKFVAKHFLSYWKTNNSNIHINSLTNIDGIALAYTVENSKIITKEKIYEIFLNSAFLGRGSYGIMTAAENYFNKTLDRLTLAEAAYLAALPGSPARLDARRNPVHALSARNMAIKSMLDMGFISKTDALKSMYETLTVADWE